MKSEERWPAFVIVIGGTSGAGKTSLVRKVTELLGDAVSFHFDDYRSASEYPPDLKTWVDEGADPNRWRTPRMAEDLRSLQMGQAISLPENRGELRPARYIVVEDPFGRSRREMAASIDFVAHIDLPMEIALARKILREFNGIAREGDPQQLKDYINGFLSDYLHGPVRTAYLEANEKAIESCDLLLDGMEPVDVSAAKIVSAVQSVISVRRRVPA
jgi:uridine kinase